MLNVIEYGKGEYDFPALLVLGCFDAIHIGHRELIKKAKLQAKINGLDLGVMLFRDGKGDKTVYTFEERLAILEECSVKFALVIDFTEEFKRTSPEDFLHAIEDKVNVKAYMSGKDFRFGAKAKGKSSTLKNYAEDEENGVWYMPVKDVTVGGEKVSTTKIKELLADGKITEANELLGSEFSVSGEVVKGAGRGQSLLGYPTVNIHYPEKKFPVKQGVYKVRSAIDGKEYLGIANYGSCPTFSDDRIALEVHFDGFNGDLYGKTLAVRFIDFIRDIVAFSSQEELISQLNEDISSLANEKVAQDGAQDELAAAQSEDVQPVETVEPTHMEEVPTVEEVTQIEKTEIQAETEAVDGSGEYENGSDNSTTEPEKNVVEFQVEEAFYTAEEVIIEPKIAEAFDGAEEVIVEPHIKNDWETMDGKPLEEGGEDKID